MEEGVFSRGYGLPPLLVPPPLPPTPKWGPTCRCPSPSCHPECHSSAPGASGCSYWGITDQGAGTSSPSLPPVPAGMRCWVLPWGCRMPTCPIAWLCTPSSREMEGSRVSPCSPRDAALAPAPACARTHAMEGFSPPHHLQHYLEFLSRSKGETMWFFSFIIHTPG